PVAGVSVGNRDSPVVYGDRIDTSAIISDAGIVWRRVLIGYHALLFVVLGLLCCHILWRPSPHFSWRPSYSSFVAKPGFNLVSLSISSLLTLQGVFCVLLPGLLAVVRHVEVVRSLRCDQVDCGFA
ncbi:unnamed protein product, partial [Ectocarpus fasciculatus]